MDNLRWCEGCGRVLHFPVLETVWGVCGTKYDVVRHRCPFCGSRGEFIWYENIRILMPHLPERPHHGYAFEPNKDVKYILGE